MLLKSLYSWLRIDPLEMGVTLIEDLQPLCDVNFLSWQEILSICCFFYYKVRKFVFGNLHVRWIIWQMEPQITNYTQIIHLPAIWSVSVRWRDRHQHLRVLDLMFWNAGMDIATWWCHLLHTWVIVAGVTLLLRLARWRSCEKIWSDLRLSFDSNLHFCHWKRLFSSVGEI